MSGAPGFHAFEFQGGTHVYDRSGPTVLQVDDAAGVLLRCREDGMALGPALSDLEERYGAEAAEHTAREYLALRRQGLFARSIAASTPGEVRRMIGGYCRWPVKGVQLFLVEGCNLRCRYCYVGRNGALARDRMPLDIARRAVDFAFSRAGRLRNVGVMFFGGEPLLHREAIEFAVEYARTTARQLGKRVSFSITTNGTMVDGEVADFLRRHRFGVTLSLDGPQEVQDSMRPLASGGSSSDLAVAGLGHLQAAGIRCLVRATVTNRCMDRGALTRFFESLGVRQVQLTYAEPRCGECGPYDIGPAAWGDASPREDALAAECAAAASGGDGPKLSPFSRVLADVHAPIRWALPCGVGRAVLTVGIDGQLYPCHRYVGMSSYVLGDLDQGLDREKLRSYYEGYFAVAERCRSCWASGVCRLRCPWVYSGDDGEFRTLPDWQCDSARAEAERVIWLSGQVKQHTSPRRRRPSRRRRRVPPSERGGDPDAGT